MNFLNSLKLAILLLTTLGSSPEKLPVNLLGRWSVGTPYHTPAPIGINAVQEKFIRGLDLVYISDHLHVCGKEISVQPISSESLAENEFLQSYGFLPRIIGMKSSPITDLKLNPSSDMNACGEYQDPGAHLLMDPGGHIVMEVANDYFPLKKEKTVSTERSRNKFISTQNRF